VVLTAPAGNPVLVPARVPAATIRAMRIFHRLSLEGMAIAFDVTLRTVYRWEKGGVDPSTMAVDPHGAPPDWRAKLLLWMLDRYESTGVSDNRKKGQA
jgi:hypothetical protein